MKGQNKFIQSNIARKAKCDSIAEQLDENNILYKINVGANIIFEMKNIEIIVSAHNIIIKNNNQEIDFNNESFWIELNKILHDPILKKI